MTTREKAIDGAAVQVMASLARQDARTPRDAAVASLGADATEQQIAEWVAMYRSDVHARPA